MFMKKYLSLLLIFTVSAILIGAIFFLPVSVPYSMNVLGKIEPSKEWVLTRNTDGILSASLINHKLDFSESSGNILTDRGDQSSFRFHPDVMNLKMVSSGDTIGFVYSFEVEFQWAQLKGELETQRATLKLYETGEKESLVNEAKLKLEYARMQAEQQRREIVRLSSLSEKQMIPSAEMERELTKLKLYDIQVNTTEAALKSMETGYKKEQLDLIRSHIHSLQEQVRVMEKRMAFSTIITPISGRMVRFAGSDTLAMVQDTTAYVLTLAIKWKDRKYLYPGQKVSIIVDNAPLHSVGIIEYVGDSVCIINGSHMIRAAAIFDKNTLDLTPGLMAQCSIECRPVRLYEFIPLYFGQ
jgi:hypothetical protein